MIRKAIYYAAPNIAKQTEEVLIINNAAPGEYTVRVFGVDGATSPLPFTMAVSTTQSNMKAQRRK